MKVFLEKKTMKQVICDTCKTKPADRTIKAKQRNRIAGRFFSDYETIDICRDCFNKMFDKNYSLPSNPPNTGSSIQNE